MAAEGYDFSEYRKWARSQRIAKYGNGPGAYKTNLTAQALIRLLWDLRSHPKAKGEGWSRKELAGKLGCSLIYFKQLLCPSSKLRPWISVWLQQIGFEEVRAGRRGIVFIKACETK